MVDHTFLFTGAVRKIRQLMEEGRSGKLYYYDSTRVNLGLFQHDVNVIWDLAPHDLSIMDYLIDAEAGGRRRHRPEPSERASKTWPTSPSISRQDHRPHQRQLASPVKVRTTLIGGEKKMLVWNDLEADEKVKVYDKGVEITNGEGVYDLLVSYRSGDMWAPRVEQTEALKLRSRLLHRMHREGRDPFNDGACRLAGGANARGRRRSR